MVAEAAVVEMAKRDHGTVIMIRIKRLPVIKEIRLGCEAVLLRVADVLCLVTIYHIAAGDEHPQHI